MPQIVIQLIGLAGMACIVWSFQQNKRALILVFLIAGQVLFCIHFGWLGAWTAAITNVVAIARGVVFYYKPHYRWAKTPVWVAVFIGACWLVGFLTWAGPQSLLIMAAMSIETVGVWRNNPKQIRWFLLAVRPLFFTYSLLVGSYAGMTADILFSTSLIVSMIRFDKQKVNP